MKKKHEYKFKPFDNAYFFIFGMLYIFPIGFFDILAIICRNDALSSVCLIMTILTILAHIFVRIFYHYKYIIDETYLTKYKGKKVIFKVKKSDIKIILVKKAKLSNYIKLFISLVAHYNITSLNITNMSFLFNDCEIIQDYGDIDMKRESLKGNEYSDYKEYIEILSYRKIKKIIKKLNVDYKIV